MIDKSVLLRNAPTQVSYDLKATLGMRAQTPNVKPSNSSNRARPVRNAKKPFRFLLWLWTKGTRNKAQRCEIPKIKHP